MIKVIRESTNESIIDRLNQITSSGDIITLAEYATDDYLDKDEITAELAIGSAMGYDPEDINIYTSDDVTSLSELQAIYNELEENPSIRINHMKMTKIDGVKYAYYTAEGGLMVIYAPNRNKKENKKMIRVIREDSQSITPESIVDILVNELNCRRIGRDDWGVKLSANSYYEVEDYLEYTLGFTRIPGFHGSYQKDGVTVAIENDHGYEYIQVMDD